ncbi:MAG: NAD-dependent DNA ligase LigA [Firmicutes bacterium]|nr:NAD-dependent DNA ligase LigA [Bacillota bacterium]
MERMKELVSLLNSASKAYYQQDKEIMSDKDYDALYDELVALEAETGIVLSDSPTQKVGYTVLSNLTKVEHPSPMLSLDKTKEVPRLAEFLGDNVGLLSYKMDGLTVVLTYENGSLKQALTRGNGVIGEDITHNARTFKNIPLSLDFKGELVLRGEAVISFKDFEEINSRLAPEDEYKNPRNLCSGTVRQLNSEICAQRSVCFIAFSLVSAEGMNFANKSEGMDWLDKRGFDTVKRKFVNKDTVAAAVREFEEFIPQNPFATDGLVLTYDNIAYSVSLGSTAKFPRDSIAFKWADETAETTLREIEWSASRTGLINPIAVFDPVELEGTTVERASLHNVSIVKNLMLGIGDTITVYKANMIIPQVAENLTKSGNAPIPDTCPVCGGKTALVSLRDGEALRCPNPNCKAKLVHGLAHFVSRDAMNIEGLSESTLEKFIALGLLNDFTDIYSLHKHRDIIVNTEGFGEKSYENLVSAIEKSKKAGLPNFIYALGIDNVGLGNAKLLCKKYNYDLDRIIAADAEELLMVDGFGDVIAASLEKYFKDEKNLELVSKMRTILEFDIPKTDNTALLLDGRIFVITGDVHHFKNRKELQAKIEALGGKATGSVSAKTSYLINNDVTSNSSKNKKAKELGIPIISEEDFLALIGEE